MTIVATADTVPSTTRPRRRVRTSTIVVMLISWLLLSSIGFKLALAGHQRPDLAAIVAGEVWRAGGWLSHLMLHYVGHLPRGLWREMTLTVVTAAATGIAFAAFYRRLRLHGWAIAAAALALGATLLHAEVLYSVTSDIRYLPVFIGVALVVPAVRHIEEVGDVQAAISLSLVLPVLLLAGPVTSLLIPLFAFGVALSDRDARRDPRAFVAMLLVAILPTVIVICGVFAFLLQAGIDPVAAVLPYAALFGAVGAPDLFESLSLLGAFAPVGVIPLLYCLWPHSSEPKRVFSALAVVALPLFLALARGTLAIDMPAFVPPVAMMAAFFAWLGQVRLPRSLRAFTLVLLFASLLLSWAFGGYATEPGWVSALLEAMPEAMGNLTLRPGV